jgi:glycosyltransferase involved in cell wall biosynthesis
MKASVVIPTYYRPKDLAELFDSLLKQTVKLLEVF